MSIIKSVALPATTVIAPSTPAGTMAAFANVVPFGEFRVDTFGKACPAGQTDKNDNGPFGTTVIFSEYARALEGMPQLLFAIGKSRCTDATRLGGPKLPAKD